jgi:flagellar hook-basal body complex protein FliE
MTDPLGLIGAASRPDPFQGQRPAAANDPSKPSFKDALLKTIEEVNRAQQDATEAVEDLQSRRRSDLEGVLIATQKADTAFKMLQAVRNKVIQAYDEIQQMRV